MIHIYPLQDLEEHDLETTTCKCNPLVEVINDVITVTHNSFDGREYQEPDLFDYTKLCLN